MLKGPGTGCPCIVGTDTEWCVVPAVAGEKQRTIAFKERRRKRVTAGSDRSIEHGTTAAWMPGWDGNHRRELPRVESERGDGHITSLSTRGTASSGMPRRTRVEGHGHGRQAHADAAPVGDTALELHAQRSRR